MNLLNIFRSKKPIAAIQAKKEHQKEVQRINDARAYMNKWDDIPMSWLQDELFKILDLPRNQGCKNFVRIVLTGNDVDQLARDLKLQRDFHKPTIHHAKY